MSYEKRFEETPFGDYDTTLNTERFPNGWYDGTITDVKNAGEFEGRKNVKLVIALDDLPTVQRKIGIAWGAKDGEPAAWVKFISSAMRKAIGDPSLRAATPRAIRGKRVACYMQWNGTSFMDIVDFGVEGYRGAVGNARSTGDAPPARNNARPAAPAADERRARSGALQPVPGNGSPSTTQSGARFTPGQLRCIAVAGDVGLDEAALRAYVQEHFQLTLEALTDQTVARVIADLRKNMRASA